MEKYLKAFLVYHKIKIIKTHNIKFLLTQCTKIDKEFNNIEVMKLSTFGVDVRYPYDLYIPDMEEVNFYYDLTKRIRALVYTKLGME